MGICVNLVTPAEIGDYLQHRQDVLLKYPSAELLPEETLVGHFVGGNLAVSPSAGDSEHLRGIASQMDEFSLRPMLSNLQDKIYLQQLNGTPSADRTQFYKILAEFLLLNRAELREAKKRIGLCVKACDADTATRPSRMASPRTGCGFVFIPLQRRDHESRWQMLHAMTSLAKYDMRLSRMLGVSFVKDGSHYLVDWCLAEGPWQCDPEAERLLTEDSPLRPVKEVIRDRYPPMNRATRGRH